MHVQRAQPTSVSNAVLGEISTIAMNISVGVNQSAGGRNLSSHCCRAGGMKGQKPVPSVFGLNTLEHLAYDG